MHNYYVYELLAEGGDADLGAYYGPEDFIAQLAADLAGIEKNGQEVEGLTIGMVKAATSDEAMDVMRHDRKSLKPVPLQRKKT